MHRECPKKHLICFHYNHISHKKADCLRLSGGVVVALAPARLRITDSRQVKAEALAVKGRAFQLTIEEA